MYYSAYPPAPNGLGEGMREGVIEWESETYKIW